MWGITFITIRRRFPWQQRRKQQRRRSNCDVHMTARRNPTGWRNDSYRHLLAGKGIKSKSYFSFSNSIDSVPERIRQKQIALNKMDEKKAIFQNHIAELELMRTHALQEGHVQTAEKYGEDIEKTKRVIEYLEDVERHSLEDDGKSYMASKYGGQKFAYARSEESAGFRPSKEDLDELQPGNTIVTAAVNKFGQKDRVEIKVLSVRGNRITGEFMTYGPAVTTTARKVFVRKGQVLQIRKT